MIPVRPVREDRAFACLGQVLTLPFTTIEAAALETAVRPSEARPVSGRTLRSNVRERRWLSMQAVQARDLPGKRLRSGQARSLRSAPLRSGRDDGRTGPRFGPESETHAALFAGAAPTA